MKLYSLVMLDLGGTLLDSNNQISPNTKRLLNRLQQRGVPVVLCSSGPPSGAIAAARRCDLTGLLVCYDGSLILDQNQNILEDTGIDGETALRLKQAAAVEFPDIAVTSCLYDIWLADSAQDPNVCAFGKRYGREAIEGPLRNALQSNGHAHKMVCLGKPLRLKAFQNWAAPLFPSLSVTAFRAFSVPADQENDQKPRAGCGHDSSDRMGQQKPPLLHRHPEIQKKHHKARCHEYTGKNRKPSRSFCG